MAPDREERKLAAILAADMVGYSRLMEADETGTLAALKTHRRELIDPKIAEYNGRIVKTTGDGMLIEFGSVVDAVQCAVDIQRAMNRRNAEVPDDRRIDFRIGINLGDIIVDGDDIYGDGVNVAARLEELAEPGEVCISGTAYDHLKKRIDVDYKYLGERNVKNISEPVRIYRMLTKAGAPEKASVAVAGGKKLRRWVASAIALVVVAIGGYAGWYYLVRAPTTITATATDQRLTVSQQDKPSIAVLPFANLSGNPEQEYFADGITEDIITDLSQISGLFVIARNSSFQYKGKSPDLRAVARDLNVKFVLEGSVRRANDQIRINAQLIDAKTGGHLWAKRYDGTLENVFALQDNVTQQIVAAMSVELMADEQERTALRETTSPAAYDAFLKGWEHYRRRTPGDFATAVGHFVRAVELDPQYGRAYAAMANIYWKSWLWTVQIDSTMALPWTRTLKIPIVYAPDRAKEHLEVAMRNPTALAHQLASEIHLHDHKFGKAIAEAERAITLNPNDPDSYVAMGQALIFAGRAEEAVQFIDRATRLDPQSAVNLYLLGLVRFSAAQMDQAVTLLERALERSPFNREWNIPLTAAYTHLGQDQAARTALGNFGGGLLTVGNIMEKWPFKDAGVAERFGSGLIKAGMCCELDVEDYVARVRQGEKP